MDGTEDLNFLKFEKTLLHVNMPRKEQLNAEHSSGDAKTATGN